jgi:opacity protein-like surface antigen
VNVGKTYFNMIGGVTGRINIPNSKFYVPFYIDAGGGALPFTWEAYTGIAYNAASWADVSVAYRYLSFQNGNTTGVRNLSLSGVLFGANFRF